LRLPVADDAWAVRHVLQYGPEAEILEPVELRRMLVERLKSMIRR
jgi:predicted DNA-binding transcriptional regulator YafY